MFKRILKIILVIVIMIIVAGACFFAYKYFTSDDNIELGEDSIIKIGISSEPIFTLKNYPKVDASLATQPLTDAFIKNFTGESEISEEYLDYTNTHPGYLRLIEKEVDLIVVTEPSEDELEYAKEKNVELEVVPVVKEGFVFYVNHQNPVDDLTVEQIQKIYTGEIKNWAEVGGNDETIRPFQRPENSGSQTGMLSLVMKDKVLMEPLKENLAESMFDIIDLVSNYDNGMDALGYSYYYYATTMFDTIDSEIADRIKLLSIDGVPPCNATIENDTYPFKTAYYIVIRKDEPEDSPARKLREAMLSERGQKVAEDTGYVCVK